MKPNHSMLGGSMERKYFDSYAKYFVQFLRSYAAEGVKINAVTVQNEVDTNQSSLMPACLWAQEDEARFVARHLRPTLEGASLDTKIWILDHNYDLWGRALDELSDLGVNRYVDSIAWHAYSGTVDAMKRVHDAFPNKRQQWTEGGAVITSPEFQTDWSQWASTFAGVLKNWGCSIVGWNLALDEEGKPNMGPGQSGGIVTIHSKTQKITRCGQYGPSLTIPRLCNVERAYWRRMEHCPTSNMLRPRIPTELMCWSLSIAAAWNGWCHVLWKRADSRLNCRGTL
jgi:glucosylceramidase